MSRKIILDHSQFIIHELEGMEESFSVRHRFSKARAAGNNKPDVWHAITRQLASYYNVDQVLVREEINLTQIVPDLFDLYERKVYGFS